MKGGRSSLALQTKKGPVGALAMKNIFQIIGSKDKMRLTTDPILIRGIP